MEKIESLQFNMARILQALLCEGSVDPDVVDGVINMLRDSGWVVKIEADGTVGVH